MDTPGPFDLAERVAQIARAHGVETALIGATALAIHGYVRGTSDIDFAAVAELDDLARVRAALEQAGLHAELHRPDADDVLGGVLRIWVVEDDGEPVEPVEVVNLHNPYRPIRLPAKEVIRDALVLAEKPALHYVRLPHLILLKLYAGSRQDLADVVAVLERNPDANLDEIRELCTRYDLVQIDQLIAEVEATRRLDGSP